MCITQIVLSSYGRKMRVRQSRKLADNIILSFLKIEIYAEKVAGDRGRCVSGHRSRRMSLNEIVSDYRKLDADN